MPNTITKIKEIEARADEIIKAAHDEAFHNIKTTNKRHEEELARVKEAALAEKKDLVAKARKEAEEEAKIIDKDSQKEIVKLKTAVPNQIKKAKEEILKCLS